MVLGGFSMVLSCGFGLVRLGFWVFLSSFCQQASRPAPLGFCKEPLAYEPLTVLYGGSTAPFCTGAGVVVASLPPSFT
jgi:hypothetical protein